MLPQYVLLFLYKVEHGSINSQSTQMYWHSQDNASVSGIASLSFWGASVKYG